MSSMLSSSRRAGLVLAAAVSFSTIQMRPAMPLAENHINDQRQIAPDTGVSMGYKQPIRPAISDDSEQSARTSVPRRVEPDA
ncbi:hypothetical protein HY990_07280 [Candidatus Micrarchaeota archaeon]|nr:hypothetical protein [Candidatus Micrarchaeota archaeon]